MSRSIVDSLAVESLNPIACKRIRVRGILWPKRVGFVQIRGFWPTFGVVLVADNS